MKFRTTTLTFAGVVLAVGLCHAQEKATIPDNIMKDMEHYVGTWTGEVTMGGKEVASEATFQWILDKHFLQIELVVKDKSTNTVVSRVNCIGGWCPIAQKYKEWVFDTDGNYSDTLWTIGEDGRRTGELSGVIDGRRVNWVNERKFVDHDTMTGVIRDLSTDDKKRADLPYKLCRQKKAEVKAGTEITLDEALKAWKFLEGNWSVTSPDGKVEEGSFSRLQSGNGYISQGQSATHFFGWNPKSKTLEIQSYLADGGRAVALFDRKPEGRIVGKSSLTDGNGNKSESEVTFRTIAADKWAFSIDEQVWTANRK